MENLSVKVEAKDKKKPLFYFRNTSIVKTVQGTHFEEEKGLFAFSNNKVENRTCPRLFSGRTRIYLQAVNIYLNKITEMHRKTTLG